MTGIGRTLLIVNPAAKNGQGRTARSSIEETLEGLVDFEIVFTQHAGHAQELAAQAEGVDTIVCVGGDGCAHEIANGILSREEGDRPAFALVPYGSGNDYARTLQMPFSPRHALKSLVDGVRIPIDVGSCNGEYFVESLSFGVDAAIAIGTVELRKKTGKSGMPLYMQSGMDVLRNHFAYHSAHIAPQGREPFHRDCLMLCVTIGETYGGGFRVAPGADPTDGTLKICTATPVSQTKAIAIFLAASKGLHTHFSNIALDSMTGLCVDFEDEPPTQIDGEERHGTHFDIAIHRRALDVIVPSFSGLAAKACVSAASEEG